MMKTLRRFWDRDESLSIFLVMLIVLVFFVEPLSRPGEAAELGVSIFFALFLVAGVWNTLSSPAFAGLAALFAVLASGCDVYKHFYKPTGIAAILVEASTFPVLALFLLIVMRSIGRAGPITSHRVKGGIAIYLLLGLIWAKFYTMIAIAAPHAFSGIGTGDPFYRLVYYSYITLTTVGYGDITPQIPLARSLAALEALVGQLFPAIFIAQLVSLQIQSKGHDQ